VPPAGRAAVGLCKSIILTQKLDARMLIVMNELALTRRRGDLAMKAPNVHCAATLRKIRVPNLRKIRDPYEVNIVSIYVALKCRFLTLHEDKNFRCSCECWRFRARSCQHSPAQQ